MKSHEKMEGLFRSDRQSLVAQAMLIPVKQLPDCIDYVCCTMCQKRIPFNSNDYLVFYGNVTIGPLGGVVGNNFHESGRLDRVQISCRTALCALQSLGFEFG